jgi:hypothetical protein
MMRTARGACAVALATILATLSACGQEQPQPWNKAEMATRAETFGHIGEAYAVLDVCVPLVALDQDARFALTEKIGARSYSRLAGMDTTRELARFVAVHASQGGTPAQHAQLRAVYRDAHGRASKLVDTVAACVETLGEWANTLLHTRTD